MCLPSRKKSKQNSGNERDDFADAIFQPRVVSKGPASAHLHQHISVKPAPMHTTRPETKDVGTSDSKQPIALDESNGATLSGQREMETKSDDRMVDRSRYVFENDSDDEGSEMELTEEQRQALAARMGPKAFILEMGGELSANLSRVGEKSDRFDDQIYGLGDSEQNSWRFNVASSAPKDVSDQGDRGTCGLRC